MATMNNAEEFRRQQQSLSEQLKQEQIRRAEQTKREGYQSLSEQLRLQRQNMMQGRQQLSEQAWSTQRNIGQQAQSRGLGSSGLRNLSLIQSQMAQGQAASSLEAQNTELQRSLATARQGITRTAEGDIRSAELSAREAMLNADREFLGQEDKRREQLLTLLSMAGEEGMTSDRLKMISDTMFGAIPSTPEEVDALLAGSVADPTGDLDYTRKANMSTLDMFNNIAGAAGIGLLAGGPLGGIIGAVAGTAKVYIEESSAGITLATDKGNKTYNTWDEAISDINKQYEGFEHSDKIKATRKNNLSKDVKFTIPEFGKDKYYDTYNEALEAYRTYGNTN